MKLVLLATAIIAMATIAAAAQTFMATSGTPFTFSISGTDPADGATVMALSVVNGPSEVEKAVFQCTASTPDGTRSEVAKALWLKPNEVRAVRVVFMPQIEVTGAKCEVVEFVKCSICQ